MVSNRALAVSLIAIRIFNAVTIKTFFQADEYWQALEPAHSVVFKYGYLTWEWREGLRSFLHPLIFVFPYKISSVFTGNLSYWFSLYLPKILQGTLTGLGEFYFYHFVKRIIHDNQDVATIALLMRLASPFNWYFSTRTFSNSLETVLTVVALYYVACTLHVGSFHNLARTFALGMITCLIRPSNAIIWLYLGTLILYKVSNSLKVATIGALTAIIITLFGAFVDFLYFGEITLPVVKFFRFNVFNSFATFYGKNDASFYISQAMPIIMQSYTPFFAEAAWRSLSNRDTSTYHFVGIIIVYVAILSILQHKEFRFIYTLEPLMTFISSLSVQGFFRKRKTLMYKLTTLVIVLNCFIAYYFTRIHERGAIEVTSVIRGLVLNRPERRTSVGFLTPCHSTPFQSHFHLDEETAHIWFLTCEPPTEGEVSISQYMDESDEFYHNPAMYLLQNMPMNGATSEHAKYPHEWPDFLVIFQHMELFMNEWLQGSDYTLCRRIFNSQFHWDKRREGDILIYERVK